MAQLRIYWEANGGKGYSQPQENSPENRASLEAWMLELRRSYPTAHFEIKETPTDHLYYQDDPHFLSLNR